MVPELDAQTGRGARAPSERDRLAARERAAAVRRAAARGGGDACPPFVPAGTLESAARMRSYAAGELPEHRVRLYRTAHGTLAVETLGDRDAGLHRLLWGSYPYYGFRQAYTSVRFAPAGSTLESGLWSEHYELAETIGRMDLRDIRSLPGADPEALAGGLGRCRDKEYRCNAETRARRVELDCIVYGSGRRIGVREAEQEMVRRALEGLDGEVWP